MFPSNSRHPRAAYTLLEVQVAFVVLGIALTGVCPMVVMQLRISQKISNGVNPQTAFFGNKNVAYLVPSADPWMRKLGAASSFSGSPPGGVAVGSTSTPVNDVTIVAPVVHAGTGETVSVVISVTPHPKTTGTGP